MVTSQVRTPTLSPWGWVPSFVGHPLSYTDGGNAAGLSADDAAARAKLRLNSSLQKVLRHLHYITVVLVVCCATLC